MPKRRRTQKEDHDEHPTEDLLPISSIRTDLGLLRRPEPAVPRILVAGMVAGTDDDIPDGMPKSRGISFLVGKRLVAPGSGTWSYPCGLLQSGERILFCASRIVREQTGLEATAQDIIRTTENVIEGEHYVTLFVFCGFPANRSQHLMDSSEWTDWHWSTLTEDDARKMSSGQEPGKPVFAPLVNLYDEEKTRDIDWDREPGILV